MDQALVNSLAAPTNQVAGSYVDMTNNLQENRMAQVEMQRARDNDMLKIFELAGDGQTDAAQFLAQQKGIQVPPEVMQNADFAKGLSLAGKIYPQDPVAAQKFVSSWMQNQGTDFQSRVMKAQQDTGQVVDPKDREFKRLMDYEDWKDKNISKKLKPGETVFNPTTGGADYSAPPKVTPSRFQAGAAAYNAVNQSGMAAPGDAEKARDAAYQEWDRNFGPTAATPSAGLLMGTQPASPAQPPTTAMQPAPQQPNIVQKLAQPQTPSGLPQGSVMLGTMGGKPVYQAPNGDKFVDDGEAEDGSP